LRPPPPTPKPQSPIPNPHKNIYFRFNCLNYYINLISKENNSKKFIYKNYNV